MEDQPIVRDVARYYTDKLATYGPTPRGVDWNGPESQTLRFSQLARIVDLGSTKSVADVGCGYGGFLPHLRTAGFTGAFVGFDASSAMIDTARAMHGQDQSAQFVVGVEPPTPVDVITASGIFGVKLTHADADWRAYILKTLDMFARVSRRGFAFNCLTVYSDKDKMRPDLYYADPSFLFDHCKRTYARNVALLHDYGLYEFTILVRK